MGPVKVPNPKNSWRVWAWGSFRGISKINFWIVWVWCQATDVNTRFDVVPFDGKTMGSSTRVLSKVDFFVESIHYSFEAANQPQRGPLIFRNNASQASGCANTEASATFTWYSRDYRLLHAIEQLTFTRTRSQRVRLQVLSYSNVRYTVSWLMAQKRKFSMDDWKVSRVSDFFGLSFSGWYQTPSLSWPGSPS